MPASGGGLLAHNPSLVDNSLYLNSRTPPRRAHKMRLDSFSEGSSGSRYYHRKLPPITSAATGGSGSRFYQECASTSSLHMAGAAAERKMSRCGKVRVVAASLTIILLSVTAAGLLGYFLSLLDSSPVDTQQASCGRVELVDDQISVRLHSASTGQDTVERFLRGNVHTDIVRQRGFQNCDPKEETNMFPSNGRNRDEDGAFCVKWLQTADASQSGSDDSVFLKVTESSLGDSVKCYDFHWQTPNTDSSLEDCYSLQPDIESVSKLAGQTVSAEHRYWYGGAQMHDQTWSIENMRLNMLPFVTNDIYMSQYGNVMEPYWITSDRFAIVVDPNVPLSLGVNSQSEPGKFCLRSRLKGTVYERYQSKYNLLQLKYSICVGTSPLLKDLHLLVHNQFFKKPTNIPDERMFRHPIWSTWAQYKKEVNQTLVLQYADEILSNNFDNSQLEIDDRWATHYGDFEFDPKFPDAKHMISQLKAKGFRVTLWTHPFSNLDSQSFLDGAGSGYWVGNERGKTSVPSVTLWWDGIGGVLDTTNTEATQWYLKRIVEFRDDVGLDSFKFDAGETTWLPHCGILLNATHPNDFTRKYVDMCAKLGKQIEVRVASQTQEHPIFVRIMDKDSRWGYDNGLKSLIPNALLFGLLGYPFILPDMIGGNAYAVDSDGEMDIESTVFPDDELFIRWVEVNALLPALQFSVTPWQYEHNSEVLAVSKRMVSLHESMTDRILDLAREATRTGAPIIRPLWWLESTPEAFRIDTEYLVGDNVLVAPIVESGASSRDVYIPAGRWRDVNSDTGDVYTGPMWIRSYQAPLQTLPYFIRAQ